jgi:hypothetical protein
MPPHVESYEWAAHHKAFTAELQRPAASSHLQAHEPMSNVQQLRAPVRGAVLLTYLSALPST